MTRGDVVGHVETSTPVCRKCEHIMDGADDKERCRVNGLEATDANADGCTWFAHYLLADYPVRPWCGNGSR